ncbi:glycosyltransferase family 39 protein [Geobacter sp. SVR]|uniref:ArnT family glycosyltransferase n=1 Tax=Geobacter sp. SVR TaxID=2495594 RepID=UPI00143EF6AF|nr:glycosyltransferase family 39 protein [Geobacter sp. SVR]BCS55506.1 hypothetical protein GSVR_38140 [Geobacter sp. SVR]GCF83509.1 hypothetical protein GSbR_01090 [Geobacter sp. SVR]
MEPTTSAVPPRSLSRFLPLAAVLGIAVTVRIILFWQDKVIAADGISYVTIAREIFRTFDFTSATHFPPLYPILIGLFKYVTPSDEMAGKVASAVMGSILVIPLYLLGKELFSKKVGYVGALLAALSPPLIAISGIVLSQATYITLLVTALLLYWKGFAEKSRILAFGGGLLFGASYLTRPEAVIVFAGMSAAFFCLRSDGVSRKDNGILILAGCGGFVLMALPYMFLLHRVYGGWQLTGKSSVTLADSLGWYLNRPDLKREYGFAGLSYLDVVRRYPDFLWKNSAKNLPVAWAELPTYLWLLAGLGFSGLAYARNWRTMLLVAAALLPLSVIIVFFWIDSHYFSPYIPIVLILAAGGLDSLERAAGRIFPFLSRGGKSLSWASAIAVAAAVFAIAPALLADRTTSYDFSQDGARYDHKLIGLMLRDRLPPQSRVMVKSGRIAFYGEFQHVDIPQASLPEIMEAARAGKARYLVADGTLFGARPQLEPFLVPLLIQQDKVMSTGPFPPVPNLPPGVRLVLLYKDPASVGVAVYEIL